MFTGLSLLVIVACWVLYKIACAIGEAPVIEDAEPGALDRLERDGLARFVDGRSDHA